MRCPFANQEHTCYTTHQSSQGRPGPPPFPHIPTANSSRLRRTHIPRLPLHSNIDKRRGVAAYDKFGDSLSTKWFSSSVPRVFGRRLCQRSQSLIAFSRRGQLSTTPMSKRLHEYVVGRYQRVPAWTGTSLNRGCRCSGSTDHRKLTEFTRLASSGTVEPDIQTHRHLMLGPTVHGKI